MLTTSCASQSKRPIARALRVFSTDDNLPIIVHCAQGRDRTGIIIALLLRALGTDEHSVALDYAETDIQLQVRGLPRRSIVGFARRPARLCTEVGVCGASGSSF